MPSPLEGITIVDLTRVLSGPTCTMLLADMGARVIKIERPAGGDETRAWAPPFVADQSAYFLSVNRNKESVALDFTTPPGARVLDALVARADVIVENFRPGTLDRYGFGYGAVSGRYPRLVYCSISGYGQTGPKREVVGYDMVAQAEGGLMSITGAAEGSPYRVGVAVADLVAGLLAANGILLALFARERTGVGQLVDISLFDSVIALLSYQAGLSLATGVPARRMGNAHPSMVPYDSFETADGFFVMGVGNDDQWRRLCKVAGLDALVEDERFRTNPDRVRNREALQPILAERFRTRTRDAWLRELQAAGVPCGAVRDIAEALADPQVAAREMVQEVEHATAGLIKVLGLPVKLQSTPGSIRLPPPLLGQHTRQVLEHDLELTAGDIDALEREGVIACP